MAQGDGSENRGGQRPSERISQGQAPEREREEQRGVQQVKPGDPGISAFNWGDKLQQEEEILGLEFESVEFKVSCECGEVQQVVRRMCSESQDRAWARSIHTFRIHPKELTKEQDKVREL